MKMKNLLIAISVFYFSFQSAANAATSHEKVAEFINDIGNNIVHVAGEKNLSEKKKREKIIAIVDSAIDPDWIAHFVLGKNYKTASNQERQRFTKLYRDFMIHTYGPKFKNYDGRKFTVNNVTERTGFYMAKAEFLPKDSNVPISVDFRVKERNGKLLILDFIAEGVSLIETQRSEFSSAISQNGVDKFLDNLEVRVEKLKKADD